jgi:hypothetical protein
MKTAALPEKRRLVSVFEKPLAEIRPSPQNEKLYRPISPDDPDIIALAESIREIGLQEPLVISMDGFIISGHRRYAACKRLGWNTIRCRALSVHSQDPEFLIYLREGNRQRVKTLAEIGREEIVSANPQDAYRELLEHRKQCSLVDVQTIAIRGEKRRARITPAKQPFLEAIIQVVTDLKPYWPITERRVHYTLLNQPPLRHARKPDSVYANDPNSYKETCDLVTRGRLFGRIPFRAIADPTRTVVTWAIHQGPSSFLREALAEFLTGYWRDLMQSQPNHVEIIGEKNTVESILRPVAMEYTIPYTIGRGYCSLPPRYEMAERFWKSGKDKLVILALSDFDPEGEDIAHSFARSMRDDFRIGQDALVPIKVALTYQQVQKMNLPPEMIAKKASSRRRKFVDRHGEHVYELEAVSPDALQQILRDAIDAVIDVDAFNKERDTEAKDAQYLDRVRNLLKEQMKGVDL